MSKTPQELFTGLQIGDLLMVPVTLPKSKEQLTAFAAVLRIGDEGEFYLGRLSEHRPDPRPDSCNPYRWSADKGALIDCDGDVPRWYSVDIQRERHGALKVAQAYTAVPRLDEFRHPFNDGEFKRFMEKDPRHAILEGIAVNGEAGSVGIQLSLALDAMGVAHDKEQAIGLAYFMERLVAHVAVSSALSRAIVIGVGRPEQEAGGADKK
ncbi:MAG: hypothetical protein E6R14_10765 [Thermomicrobiales bacterium]|nr:MAG: hypothetical protein E6R14_10765 [Thermomicrobiales bacterium]